MTISIDETVLEVRRQFRDVAWSNATLKAWIKDAVRDYSIHFPYKATLTDDAADDVYEYDFFEGTHDEEDLPVVFGVLEVEYPTGEDPPEYPTRVDHTDSHFFGDGESYYDIVLNPSLNNGEIWLSAPETGSSFQVKYLTEHSWTAVDTATDENTEVPGHHRPVIIQYVIWQCWRELMTVTREEDDILKFEHIERQVTNASSRYAQMIEQIKGTRPSESKVIPWSMDKYDRIY